MHNRGMFPLFLQNQIKRKLSQPVTIAYIAELLESSEFINRTELANFLCEECKFRDARGRPQLDGCLKALRELEALGHFTLPAAQGKPGPSNALSSSCANAQAVAEGCGGSNGRARSSG